MEEKCEKLEILPVLQGGGGGILTYPSSSVSPCPGSVGEHVALKHQRRVLSVDEAEKCGFGRGSVQTGASATCSAHPEPPVR